MINPYEPPKSKHHEREPHVEPLVYWEGFFMVVFVISIFFLGDITLRVIREIIIKSTGNL